MNQALDLNNINKPELWRKRWVDHVRVASVIGQKGECKLIMTLPAVKEKIVRYQDAITMSPFKLDIYILLLNLEEDMGNHPSLSENIFTKYDL